MNPTILASLISAGAIFIGRITGAGNVEYVYKLSGTS